MKSVTWSNGIGPRGRSSFLLFVRGDDIFPFVGQSIPELCVVRGTDYVKNGKWSHTTYRIEVRDDIRVISGRAGFETGRFTEGLGSAVNKKNVDTWPQVADALGVSVPSAMAFLSAWRPEEAAKLDEVELALESLEDKELSSGDGPVHVVVSFGGPTNRQIDEGYWKSPKSIPGFDGATIELIDGAGGWEDGNIRVCGITGTIMSVRHTRGYHGGYYAVSVAVVPPAEVADEGADEALKSAMAAWADLEEVSDED